MTYSSITRRRSKEESGCRGSSGIINYDSLYITADRAALDTIVAARIEKALKENGLLPVAKVDRPAKFIAEAAKLGVGANDPAQIEHRVI